jgi:hypothetical protein
VDVDAVLGGLYELVAPHLTEKRRRLLAGAAARALGRGGGARMARISGLSRPTVYTGVRELDDPPDPRGRIRRPGGGPRRLAEWDPGLLAALDELVDPDTRGDPTSPLRWTSKSTPPARRRAGRARLSGLRRHRWAAAQAGWRGDRAPVRHWHRGGPPRRAEVAAAGEATRALAYARRAGDRAMGVYAYEQAAVEYQRALRALRFAGPDEPPARSRRRVW